MTAQRTLSPESPDAPQDQSRTDPARALIERLRTAGLRSTAELLHELRQAFPDAPLSVRVQALQAIGTRRHHIPR